MKTKGKVNKSQKGFEISDGSVYDKGTEMFETSGSRKVKIDLGK